MGEEIFVCLSLCMQVYKYAKREKERQEAREKEK